MADKQTSLQDLFLNALRRSKTPLTMFLVKGVKLQGIVTWFDNFSVLLRRDGQSAVDLQARNLDDHAIWPASTSGRSLESIRRYRRSDPQAAAAGNFPERRCASPTTSVTMFLVNGVMLQGVILRRSICSACCCNATAWRSSSTNTRSRRSNPSHSLNLAGEPADSDDDQ